MIYRVQISQMNHSGLNSKVIDFDELNKAQDFIKYQLKNDVNVKNMEIIKDGKLSEFTKWKQDYELGEYGYGYTMEDGIESNALYLDEWKFIWKLLEKRLEKKLADDNLKHDDLQEIETLERVCASISCDFGNYTEEFNERFYKPYFNKFERK